MPAACSRREPTVLRTTRTFAPARAAVRARLAVSAKSCMVGLASTETVFPWSFSPAAMRSVVLVIRRADGGYGVSFRLSPSGGIPSASLLPVMQPAMARRRAERCRHEKGIAACPDMGV